MRVHTSATLRELAETRAEKAGLTRFFRNPKVTVTEILETAAQRTAAAAAGRDILLIQDTSEINYQSKSGRKRHLGRVGNGTDVGLFIHPLLAVDAQDGSLFGLAGATIWRRTKVKAANYQSLPIEEKESHRWLATPLAARTAFAAARRATIVCDRESDIYELFARVPKEGLDVLVRATRDRALTTKGGRLFAALSALPEAGRIGFDLEGRPGRSAREVTLAVRYGAFTFRQPRTGADPRDPRQITLNIVEVQEIDPPASEDSIIWRLITTHSVETLEDAARMVDFYRRRWIIEQVFRTLKSQGLALEESFLADGAALENLVATALVAAVAVMQLVQGRGAAGHALQASRVFTAQEIDVLAALIKTREGKTEKQKNPHPAGSLAWAAWAIARLGGWNGYGSERPPGPITFTRGLKRFHAMAEGFKLAAQLST
jgi:hypothetical protein